MVVQSSPSTPSESRSVWGSEGGSVRGKPEERGGLCYSSVRTNVYGNGVKWKLPSSLGRWPSGGCLCLAQLLTDFKLNTHTYTKLLDQQKAFRHISSQAFVFLGTYTTKQKFGCTFTCNFFKHETLEIYDKDTCKYAANTNTCNKSSFAFMKRSCFEEFTYKICSTYFTLVLFLTQFHVCSHNVLMPPARNCNYYIHENERHSLGVPKLFLILCL